MTLDWNWRHSKRCANDLLSAAKTLQLRSSRYEIDVTSRMTPSSAYLQWARQCLEGNTPLAWDAALCYAKRAACREIDAFMKCNHLGCFLGAPYPKKIMMLSSVGLHIPDIVYELIIDPRNDVEHSYKTPPKEEAKHALELAELFIKATEDERKHHAIISIEWSITIREERGPNYERIEFRLTRENTPMLLIDVCADDHVIMVILPSDGEILSCPLKEFSSEEAIALAKMLRQHYAFEQEGNYSLRVADCGWFGQLKRDIGL